MELPEGATQAEEGLEENLCCENPVLKWTGTIRNAAIVCLSCGFTLCDDGQLIDWHDPEQIAWEEELRNSVTSH